MNVHSLASQQPSPAVAQPLQTAPKRRVSFNVIGLTCLAAFAILIAGVFTSESFKHSDTADRKEAKVRSAAAALERFEYDARGNVDPAKHQEHHSLVLAMKAAPHARKMRDTAQLELGIAGGAFLVALVLSGLAFRASRATA